MEYIFLPIFAKLAQKIHKPIINGVSTLWNDTDITGYLMSVLECFSSGDDGVPTDTTSEFVTKAVERASYDLA